MNKEVETNPKEVKKKQQNKLIILVVIVACVFFGLYMAISNNAKPSKKEEKPETINFASPLEHTNEVNYLLEKTQNKLSEQNQVMQKLQEQVNLLNKGEHIEDKNGNDKYQELEQEIGELKKMLMQGKGRVGQNGFQNSQVNGMDLTDGIGKGINTLNSASEPNIVEDKLELTHKDLSLNFPSKNPSSYVPSGTFVKAITLGGADAGAGAISQSNPSPMLFRVLDNGTLPNHQHSNLKGCTVIGAVAGDISSERGLVRLERMSCTHTNSEIVDISVEGTVFGPEGKNGIRGIPLWREGALLLRAAVAGSLSGFSQALSQNYVTNSVSPLGNTQTINDAFKYGAAQGVSNAMDKLAQYNIQRAEQYHPVIQLSAGTVVDIVFLKGFYLDGKEHNNEDNVATNNNSNNFTNDTVPSDRGDNTNNSNSADRSSLVLTKAQIERIKEHEEALETSGKRGT